MKKVRIERIFHHERWRYAIFTPYNQEILKTIRSIPGIRYSGTHRCWYTDERDECLKNILDAFRGKAETDCSFLSGNGPGDPATDKKTPVLTVQSPGDNDGHFVPFREIQKIGPGKDDEFQFPEKYQYKGPGRYGPVEFRVEEDHLVIRFTGRYEGQWIEELKTYGKLRYSKERKEFYLPWSMMTVDSLSDYFSGIGVRVIIIKKAVKSETAELRVQFAGDIQERELTREGREAIITLKQHLEENRYSIRTIESYTSVLEIFFRYFNMKYPAEISHEEISCFMNEFIIKNGFSASYQNQMISAIKLYYKISGKKNIVPSLLERPRRSRALPKVFSKDEVTRILNSAGNTKHKMLLWIIYSCGLRRSEVTNILLTDIDRVRNIIHIREGKGGIDRIVPVPDRVWTKYDEYIESYRPVKYLFEGQAGGRYSVESVHNVFKQALQKAGIRKDVGVHSLRHSFATHLHENGLDIRFIQELLGHKSTRTTEIYTHVSRRNLAAIKSPIEDLDLK